MITKVIGKVDGKEVIFERAEGDLWNTTVPLDLDGMYVVEVTAYDDAENVAYKDAVDCGSSYAMRSACRV